MATSKVKDTRSVLGANPQHLGENIVEDVAAATPEGERGRAPEQGRLHACARAGHCAPGDSALETARDLEPRCPGCRIRCRKWTERERPRHGQGGDRGGDLPLPWLGKCRPQGARCRTWTTWRPARRRRRQRKVGRGEGRHQWSPPDTLQTWTRPGRPSGSPGRFRSPSPREKGAVQEPGPQSRSGARRSSACRSAGRRRSRRRGSHATAPERAKRRDQKSGRGRGRSRHVGFSADSLLWTEGSSGLRSALPSCEIPFPAAWSQLAQADLDSLWGSQAALKLTMAVTLG
uniref:uncharacterized protein LOC123455365 n=1 Tax=Jaculus jaculus TaxID=51337 RepID=UPI001E1B1A37|nr:uncharacterized protein LOC123455365 [Jaculus jaculus]